MEESNNKIFLGEQLSKSIFGRMYNWTRNIIPFSFGFKMIAGAFLGLISGTQIVSLFLEYSIHNYCIKYGVRIPVEGVGLLKPTAVLCSFSISLFLGVAFVLLIFILKYALYYFTYIIIAIVEYKLTSSKSYDKLEEIIRSTLNSRVTIAAKNLLLIISIVMFIIGVINLSCQNNCINTKPFHNPGESFLYLSIHFFLIVFLASQVSASKNKPFSSFFALFISISLFFSIIFFLPGESNLTYFLRLTKYGGGVPTVIERDCKNNVDCIQYESGALFLITEDYYMLYKDESNELIEIPIKDVMMRKYPTEFKCSLPPLKNRPYAKSK